MLCYVSARATTNHHILTFAASWGGRSPALMTQARPAVWLRNLALLYHVSVASAVERCTDSDPVMAGSFDGHTFLPTKGCYLGVPDVPDIFALLAGTWLYTCGGSNAWATHSALANQLAPGYLAWFAERYPDGNQVQPDFFDLASVPRPSPHVRRQVFLRPTCPNRYGSVRPTAAGCSSTTRMFAIIAPRPPTNGRPTSVRRVLARCLRTLSTTIFV